MYALLEMKKIFMRIKYALGGVKSFKYLETNTTVYISCVLNEIPALLVPCLYYSARPHHLQRTPA